MKITQWDSPFSHETIQTAKGYQSGEKLPNLNKKMANVSVQDVASRCKWYRDGDLRVMPVDLRRHSYVWETDAVPLEQGVKVKMVREFVTLHTYGHPSIFRPTVSEVFSQLPMDLVQGEEEQVSGEFFIDTIYYTYNARACCTPDDTYHIAVTRFYVRA